MGGNGTGKRGAIGQPAIKTYFSDTLFSYLLGYFLFPEFLERFLETT